MTIPNPLLIREKRPKSRSLPVNLWELATMPLPYFITHENIDADVSG